MFQKDATKYKRDDEKVPEEKLFTNERNEDERQ